MDGPESYEVQEAVERCLALIAEMPDGEVTTVSRLLEMLCKSLAPENADLYCVTRGIMERSQDINIRLDNGYFNDKFSDLSFEPEFVVSHT